MNGTAWQSWAKRSRKEFGGNVAVQDFTVHGIHMAGHAVHFPMTEDGTGFYNL